jgi:pyruvate dehydrogenase E2 component (dihydrolipoamide acetyltransferase)
MATEFKLVQAGTLAKVLVSVGDTIEEEQPVLELETDKAVVEVPSDVAGVVQEIHVKAGQKLEEGATIFTMAAAGAADSSTQASVPATQESVPPTPGESQNASANGNANGNSNANESANSAAKSEDDGMTQHTAPGIEAGKGVPIGGNGAADGASNGDFSNGSSGGGIVVAHAKKGSSVAAAPSVRRLARELGVDIAQVEGSGNHGRISFADVKSFLQRNTNGQTSSTGYSVPPIQLPDFSKYGEVERQTMSGIRRATADHMARCWATVPHVTQFDRVDITELEKLRKQFGPKAEKAGGKLTVTAIALKVVASALKTFPQFNASIDMASNEIVLKKYINIGVAVDTDRGLLVPVIRDVDKKNILELTTELTTLGEKARTKKTTLEEMQGGCFTITNLGGIGGTNFTPIVNTPEVAILGISRGTTEPVWNGNAFEPRMMMPLSLSYDHRAIDGADGARFLRWIAQALEQPFLLSLEG